MFVQLTITSIIGYNALQNSYQNGNPPLGVDQSIGPRVGRSIDPSVGMPKETPWALPFLSLPFALSFHLLTLACLSPSFRLLLLL